MSATELETLVQPKPPGTDRPELAHLVLKMNWPVALCGATVVERFGASAPGMDRCAECLAIARRDRLGSPGWRD